MPELDNVAPDLDAERREELFGECSARDAGRRLTGRCPFENVAKVTRLILLSAGEIGVAGPWTCDETRILRLLRERFGRHHVVPVDEIAVLDRESDRRTERLAVTHAGDDLDRVGLDLHPPAAAVTLLPPPKLVVDGVNIDRQTRRKALDNGYEGFAVRFACGCEFEVHEYNIFSCHRHEKVVFSTNITNEYLLVVR